MTDKYGNGDQEAAGADDVTPEAETWHDNQPPVDDFADHPTEETATVSEEEAEMHEEGSAGMETEGKKRSIMLPVAAAIGGLLFLGAVVYWQFGTTQEPTVPPPPPLSTAQKAPDTSPAAAPLPPPDTTTADTNAAPTTSLPQPTEAKTAATTSPTSGVAVPVPSPAVPQPAATPTTLSADTLAKAPPSPAPVVSAPGPAPLIAAAPVPAPISRQGSTDDRLNTLTAHVEDLQKSLAQTTQQLGQISNMLAANAPASSASGNTSFDERLNKVEQQLMQMQHAVPVTAPSPVVTQETPTAVVADATPEKPVSTSATVSHRHKATHKVSYVPSHKNASHTKVSKAHWVLRAATPDEAWVSTDASSSELRHVQVGDTLAGIGHVRSIQQNGDDWVVVGSQGSIH